MRPDRLTPLFASVASIKGLGPRLAKLVERAAGPLVLDLIYHRPTGLIDRSRSPPLAEARAGEIVTLTLTVEAHQPGSGRLPWRVRCTDGTGWITLVFFQVRGDWLERALPVGAERVVSGKLDQYNDQWQMTHPDHIAPAGELDLPIEPVYGLTAGLTLKVMRKAIETALTRLPSLPEWQDPALLAREGWSGWAEALTRLHHPGSAEDLEPLRPPRRRLAYDELLSDQLAIALIRAHARRQPGRALVGDGRLQQAVTAAMPFRLTGAQTRAIAEIAGDMAASVRMLRLLQGDVGSGKTVVALMAMLIAVEAGTQAALMAPTEILARQHAATLARLAAPAGLTVALLTGRDKGRTRQTLLEGLADGRIPIVVGTHSLVQDEVLFRDLGLIVVDEQHRFGVEQRALLAAKGRGVDILTMTATPIPRSLMMTGYGDLDASRLDEKPPGRQPVRTSLVSLDRLEEVVEAVGRALAKGEQIFWVCPLIEESETSDLAAAADRHRLLTDRFGARVALVHGRMRPAERDAVMAGFVAGETRLLVATTVIEVGVDVPAATVMVIEHAERFGLAQLHQLRGRVGRGEGAAACLLLYAGPLGATARARLKILRETEDGFRIAEEDLVLRGAGEILGTRQSGLPDYRVADLAVDQDLLAIAHDEARLILARDPGLEGPRGTALRTLLYLFQRDAAVKYLRTG